MWSDIGGAGSTPAVASDLVDLVYEAAADASRWQRLLDAYTQAIGARRACLILNSGPRNGAVIHGDRFLAEEAFEPARVGHPEGTMRLFHLGCPSALSRQSGARRESDPTQAVRYGLAGIFFRSADACSMIVAVRGEEDGPFFESALELLRPLLPHLRRATILHDEIFSLRSRLAAFAACLDRWPYPLLLTTAEAQIIYANLAVNDTRFRDHLSISSGTLMLTSRRHSIEFTTALESVARNISALAWVELRRPSNGSPF